MLQRHLDLNTTTPLIESVSFNLSFLGNSVSLTDTLASRHPHTWLEISFYRNTAKLAHDTNAPHSHRIQLKRHTKRENHSKAPLSPLFPGDSHACSWLSPRGKEGGACREAACASFAVLPFIFSSTCAHGKFLRLRLPSWSSLEGAFWVIVGEHLLPGNCLKWFHRSVLPCIPISDIR